jgi:hypothetical protein
MMLDASVPEAIRRPKRWGMVLSLAVFLTLAVTMMLDTWDVLAGPNAWLVWSCAAVAGPGLLLCHVASKRAIRRAAAHDHLLCPDCTYDLRTLDATGTCPECGRAYEHDAVRAQWVDAARRLKRK